jgi:hypothetical protein
MKQLELFEEKKAKELTKHGVYAFIQYESEYFKRIDFFRWLTRLEDKAYRRGYRDGKYDGYNSGWKEGKASPIPDNY